MQFFKIMTPNVNDGPSTSFLFPQTGEPGSTTYEFSIGPQFGQAVRRTFSRASLQQYYARPSCRSFISTPRPRIHMYIINTGMPFSCKGLLRCIDKFKKKHAKDNVCTRRKAQIDES